MCNALAGFVRILLSQHGRSDAAGRLQREKTPCDGFGIRLAGKVARAGERPILGPTKDLGIQQLSFSIVGPLFYGNGAPHLGAGFVPLPSQYSNARSRDATDFAALGRVELDARTQSPLGTPCDLSFAFNFILRIEWQRGICGSLGSHAAMQHDRPGLALFSGDKALKSVIIMRQIQTYCSAFRP